MTTPQRSQQASPVRETQPGMWAARPAAAWCVLFASAHLYWALGGTVGFVAATGSLDLLKQTWFVVVGLWGVALVCLAGALVCLAYRIVERTVQWPRSCCIATRSTPRS
jgi:hypothetical protein